MKTITSVHFSSLLNTVDSIEIAITKDCAKHYSHTLQLADDSVLPCKWRMRFDSTQIDPNLCVGPEQECTDVVYQFLRAFYISVDGQSYNLISSDIDLGVAGAGATIEALIEAFLEDYGVTGYTLTVTHTPVGGGDYTLVVELVDLPYYVRPTQMVMVNDEVCYIINPFLCRKEAENIECTEWTATIDESVNAHTLTKIYLEDGSTLDIGLNLNDVLADPTAANVLLEAIPSNVRLAVDGRTVHVTGTTIAPRLMILPNNPGLELPFLIDMECTEYSQEVITCAYEVKVAKTEYDTLLATSALGMPTGALSGAADEEDDDFYYLRSTELFWVTVGKNGSGEYMTAYCYTLLGTNGSLPSSKYTIDNNGIHFNDSLFSADGVYSIDVKFIEANGNFESIKDCILVDDELKCRAASAILRQPNTRISSLYRALQLATECGDCECERACEILRALKILINKSLGGDKEYVHGPC